MRRPFAYLFERFPSFVQVFCIREVEEMTAQGMDPMILSVREAETGGFESLAAQRQGISYIPDQDTLRKEVRELAAQKRIPRTILPAIQQWPTDKPDKMRLYEAAWAGHRLRKAGIRHVHSHFAGIAARSALWMKRFYGISYSFTGHANDIFVSTDLPVTVDELIREAAFVATVSEFSASNLRKRFPDSARRIHRVYNGIDPTHFRQVDPSKNGREILSVGRLVEKKGYPDLIKACGILKERGTKFSCRIVGDGPLEGELRRLIKKLELDDCVELCGPRSQDDLRVFFAQSRIFVLACNIERDGGMDNLPTVITEAMMAGLPVVSTRLAGVPEQVLDGKTGILTEPGDSEGIATALGKLLSDDRLTHEMGAAGRRHAQHTFSLAHTVRSLKRLLCRQGRALPTSRALVKDPTLLLCKFGLPLR
jgi:glycosyltransferase involved in cell wall biosynthesis